MDSTMVDLSGPTYIANWGGRGRAMLLVHGLGAAHSSLAPIAPLLAATHRVMGLDLIGHGFTPLGDRRPTMHGHTALVESAVVELQLDGCILVGNSMGGLVCAMAAERSPHLVAGLVLIDPALPIASWSVVNRGTLANIAVPMIPGIGGLAMRHYERSTTPEQQVDNTLEFVTSDPTRVTAEYRRVAIDMARERRAMPWATDVFMTSARSLTAMLTQRRRVRRMLQRVTVPTLLIHGAEDRLVARASAEQIAADCPDWSLRVLDGIGHVPQIEAPETTARIIESWIDAAT